MSKLIMNAPGLYDMTRPYWRPRYIGDPGIAPPPPQPAASGLGHYQPVPPPEYWGQTMSVFDPSSRQMMGVSGYPSHWGPPSGVFKHSNRGFGAVLPETSQAQLDCLVQGGNWDPAKGLCAPPTPAQKAWRSAVTVARVASVAAGAYHGYKRNNSVGWAIWWAIMGGIAPVITPAIAVAQGFGKPARK